MADIQAFRAIRYDLGQVGALSDVVAPPYDVIDPALQEALYRRSPHNVIRLELNKEEPGDSENENRYTRAAHFLRDWLRGRILTQDSARSLYVLHQQFEVEGQKYIRKGFFARVRLEPFGQGQIYPHEETMSGPKADRLKLLQATAVNLSPVFGIYPDPDNAIQAALERTTTRSLPLEATDHLGIVSRLWPVCDQHVVSTVTGLMGPRPIYIADGHHRYETGLRYLEERSQAGDVSNDDAPPNFILMMLVGMSDPGLVILPTHRLISGYPGLTADQLGSILTPYFDVEMRGQGNQGCQKAWEWLQADGGQASLSFGTREDNCWLSARLRSAELMAQLAASHSPAWRDLAVSVLHVLVLDHLLRKATGIQAHCHYVHQLREVQDALDAGQCDLAALVPPATMRDVEQIAGSLEKMPPKSTYFYPKLLTGLVFNSLKH